ARCRTNVPGIFAAGDVATHLHPLFGRIRVEHYNNAEKQGAAAARSMLGALDEYRYLHTFWSDQYEHKLEYVGHVRKWDQFVVRGSSAERRLIGFYLQAGSLRAAVGLNRGGTPAGRTCDPGLRNALCPPHGRGCPIPGSLRLRSRFGQRHSACGQGSGTAADPWPTPPILGTRVTSFPHQESRGPSRREA